MDRIEKLNDPATPILQAMMSVKAEMWTSLPAQVVSYDATKMTAQVQPTLQARVQTKDAKLEWVSLPLLVDCPVVFPNGGGVMMTFPLEAGDEVLVVFASRCIDNWWLQGGIQTQAEIRMHDLSDGFCFPGPRSLPRVPDDLSPTAMEIRTDDGQAKIAINPVTKAVVVQTTGDVSVTSGAAVSIAATQINLSGILVINGTPFLSHRHSGVTSGSGNSSGVV